MGCINKENREGEPPRYPCGAFRRKKLPNVSKVPPMPKCKPPKKDLFNSLEPDPLPSPQQHEKPDLGYRG